MKLQGFRFDASFFWFVLVLGFHETEGRYGICSNIVVIGESASFESPNYPDNFWETDAARCSCEAKAYSRRDINMEVKLEAHHDLDLGALYVLFESEKGMKYRANMIKAGVIDIKIVRMTLIFVPTPRNKPIPFRLHYRASDSLTTTCRKLSHPPVPTKIERQSPPTRSMPQTIGTTLSNLDMDHQTSYQVAAISTIYSASKSLTWTSTKGSYTTVPGDVKPKSSALNLVYQTTSTTQPTRGHIVASSQASPFRRNLSVLSGYGIIIGSAVSLICCILIVTSAVIFVHRRRLLERTTHRQQVDTAETASVVPIPRVPPTAGAKNDDGMYNDNNRDTSFNPVTGTAPRSEDNDLYAHPEPTDTYVNMYETLGDTRCSGNDSDDKFFTTSYTCQSDQYEEIPSWRRTN